MSEQDTREKLNEELMDSCLTFADHGGHLRAFSYVSELLDRQAAITEREVKERVNFSLITQTANALFPDYQERIDELTAERDRYEVLAVNAEQWKDERDELTAEVDNLRKRNDSQADTIRRLRAEFDAALDDLARAVEDKRSHPF